MTGLAAEDIEDLLTDVAITPDTYGPYDADFS